MKKIITLSIAVVFGCGSPLLRSNFLAAQIFTKNTSLEIVTAAEVTGSSWVDYDNDGDLDAIVFANNVAANNPGGYHYIFQNNCGTSFTRITSGLGGGIEQDNGSGWADIDSDGDVDLYIPEHAIYYNNGNGTFNKITGSPLIDPNFHPKARPAFGDFDNDGDLDVIVTTWSSHQVTFFRNDGGGNYSNIPAGDVTNAVGTGTAAQWGDYDNDGYMDIFVSTIGNGGKNKLYKNNANGTFTQQTTSAVEAPLGSGYGGSWLDYDNDKDLDLYVPNSFPPGFKLFNNDGAGNFTEVSASAGLTTVESNNDGHAWGDVDNDGDLDLYQSTFQKSIFWLNNGNGTFTENTTDIVVNDILVEPYGASMVDFDNDGDLDLFVATNSGFIESLFYTNNGNSNSWVNIRCKGINSNAAAIGARVYVKATIGGIPKWQFREMNGNPAAFQHNNNVANERFGLGNASIIDSIKVIWPKSGITQYFTNVIPNRFIDIIEGVNTIANSKQCGEGSTCETAIDLGRGDTNVNNISTNDSQYWISFIPDSISAHIKITNDTVSANGHINRIVVYSGSCAGLTVVDSLDVTQNDSIISLSLNTLTVGNIYYVKCMATMQNVITVFDISITNMPPLSFLSFSHAFTYKDDPCTQCGLNYCLGSVRLNQRTSPGAIPPTGLSQPANIMINCLPAAFTLRDAYIYFVCVGNTPSAIPFTLTNPLGVTFTFTATITANGTGKVTNNATCWGYPYKETTTGYRTLVTSAIPITNGNGSYIINGLPANITTSSPNKTDTDGATLLIIYNTPCSATSKQGSLFLMDGLSVIFGGAPYPNLINISPFTSYGTNVNGSGLYAIGDVESVTFPNVTICTFGTNPGTLNAPVFWETISTSLPFASNTTGMSFQHANNGSSIGGADCSAIPFVGVYFQDANSVGSLLIVNAGADKTVCPGTSVMLGGSPSAIGGTPLYTYSWSSFPPGFTSNVSNPAVSPSIGITTYTLLVTDANGCTSSDVLTITINPPPTISLINIAHACFGTNTGSVTLGMTGGFPPFIYSWNTNPVQTILNATNLSSGNYQLTVTDALGCTSIHSFIVPVIPLPASPIIIGNPNDCVQPTTYSVTPLANTTYNWSVTNGTPASGNGATTGPITWTAFPASITFTATDINSGCSSSSTMYIYECCSRFPTPTTQLPEFNNTSITGAFLQYGSPLITFSGVTYFITNKQVVINGTFTVDADLTISASDVFFGPEAKIFVQGGKTFSIESTKTDASVLMAACDVMWDGIYLENNSANLFTTSAGFTPNKYTIIQDAKNAIVSNQGGGFSVFRTILERNNKDIVVNSYSGLHKGAVWESILRTGATPMWPYYTGAVKNPALPRTNIGIQISEVADLEIGNPSQSAFTNIFDKMDYGIFSTRSKLRVYNNTFQNINTTTPVFPAPPPPLPNGIAIYAFGGKVIAYTPGITVGGKGFKANTFTSKVKGIFTGYGVMIQTHLGNAVIDIIGNKFQAIYHQAISLSTCRGTININNNTIKESPPSPFPIYTAIGCKDISSSTTNINGNIIEDLYANNSANKITTGIYVQNPLLQQMNLTIQGNDIKNHRIGIGLISVSGLSSTKPLVENNMITFANSANTFSANSKHVGIALQGCNNVRVKLNTIKRNGTVNAAMVQNLRGIYLKNSQNCTIGSGNFMFRMGSGIDAEGADNGSILACNDFERCWEGIHYSATTIGHQTPGGVSQHNRWKNNSGPSKMDGNVVVNPTDFYYNLTFPNCGANGFSCDPTPVPIGLATSGLPSNITSVGTDICPTLIAPPPIDAAMRQQLYEAVAMDQMRFSQDSAERKYWSRQDAFRFFNQNPNALTLGAPDDNVYQSFYDQTQSTSIGKFQEVINLLEQGDTTNGLIVNSSVTPTSLMETNRQTVNRVYIQTWAAGILGFSAADSSTLLDIAMQTPLFGGDGVYGARVMLGIDPEQSGPSSSKTMQVEAPYDESKNFSKIYPNPSDGIMQIDYRLEKYQTGEIIIYDIFGKKMSSYPIAGDGAANTLKINSIDLQNGIYLYSLKVDGELVESEKIIIIK